MRSPQKTVVQVAAWLALLIFSPQIAQAQELRPFAITDYGGETSFEVLYQTEVAESKTRDQEFEELTMKETVGLWSKGYIYHPDLLEFDAGFDLGLSQERETGEVEEDRSSELIGYDVHLAIEQNQPYGVDLFALKNQRIVEQKFAPNSIVALTQYRLIWSTDNRFLPTTVHLSSSTTEQTGIVDRTEEDQRITISSRNSLGDFSRTNMRYQFRDFNQEEFDFKTESHDLNVSNTLFFDDSKAKRLNSNVLYRTQKNGVTNDQISGLTRFSWQHTRDFQSFYGLRLSNTSVSSTGAEAFDTFTHDEEVGFRHQLYENLTTVASLENSEIDSDTLQEHKYGGRVDFRYTRPIPIGTLGADFGYSFERTDQQTEAGVSVVIDESHTLSVGFPVFLDNRNVDVSSVLITDAFVTLLVEGLDYELQVVGEEVRVVRLRDPVFPIVGEEILVDYLFMPGGDLLYDSTTIHAGASVELFRRFRISYRFNDVSQDLREGDPETNRLQEVTDHRVDIRYFEGNRSGFGYEVSAFYQDHDSTFSPFVSYGVDGNIVFRVWERNTMDLSASYSISEFPDTDEETDVLTTTGTLVSAVGPTSNLILEALYRDVGGSIDERTSFKFSVRFQAIFRLVRLSVEASHEVENERDQDRETSLVFMKVTRSF